MIGKDEFGNLHLRERRKGGERLCICRYEVIISLWCEELVTDGFCFICEESCKVISCRVDEGGGGGGQRREENVLKTARESEQLLILLW